ncbi:MAG: hypothetical protein E7523_05310 [Ruminococcaceae bacterium]|nr:hypothetical protein [Oscillospiraceae bacterium]
MLEFLNNVPMEVRPLISLCFLIPSLYLFFRLATKGHRVANNYKKVRLGQTSKEVIKLLGRPNRKQQQENGKMKYEWYHDTPVTRFKFAGRTIAKNESIHRFVSVTFANDRVIGVDAANMN